MNNDIALNKHILTGFEEQHYWVLFLNDFEEESNFVFYKNETGILLEGSKEYDFSWELKKNVIVIGYSGNVRYIKIDKKEKSGFSVKFYKKSDIEGEKPELLSTGTLVLKKEQEVVEKNVEFSFIGEYKKLENSFDKLILISCNLLIFIISLIVCLFLPIIGKSIVIVFVASFLIMLFNTKLSFYVFKKITNFINS